MGQPTKLRALPWATSSLSTPTNSGVSPLLDLLLKESGRSKWAPLLELLSQGLADCALREAVGCWGQSFLGQKCSSSGWLSNLTPWWDIRQGAGMRQRHYLFFCSTAKFFLKVGLIWLSSSTREWLRKRGLAGLGLK